MTTVTNLDYEMYFEISNFTGNWTENCNSNDNNYNGLKMLKK